MKKSLKRANSLVYSKTEREAPSEGSDNMWWTFKIYSHYAIQNIAYRWFRGGTDAIDSFSIAD
jgi:hypothetical protein